ncbi:MAG: hypothetical protein KGQ50_06365 [Bacteroidetes bacterium]|nr:hypothetical protein [Bacteroidota bacterium]
MTQWITAFTPTSIVFAVLLLIFNTTQSNVLFHFVFSHFAAHHLPLHRNTWEKLVEKAN